MARPAFNLLHHGVALALLAAAYAACMTGTGDSNSGGGGSSPNGSGNGGALSGGSNAAGGTPAPVVNRWWVTCPLFGCPDVPAASLPCNADEQEGQPCNHPGIVCDNRLPCGAIVICAGNDPKGNGCP